MCVLLRRLERREKNTISISADTHTHPFQTKLEKSEKKVMTPNEKFRTWEQKRNGKFNSIRAKAKRKRKGHTNTHT